MPGVGCRKIADAFNRLYNKSKTMTVGKTFVNTTIRQHHYEIKVLRKKIKHLKPKPRPIAHNIIWAMDLTGKTDRTGKQHLIISVVEHSSRVALFLGAINSKFSCHLILVLCSLIKQFGTPKCIRTDNEAVFTSKWFTGRLFLLGIRHQTIELHCPWQNGRVERFFGTLKERLNNGEVGSQKQLNEALKLFQFWYNVTCKQGCTNAVSAGMRKSGWPHQHLDGRTPTEVWNGVDIKQQGYRESNWFEAWDGLLTGYYFRT